ncbi:hypothetical protein Droror1_Dr00021430 [Drosera rotundifolia]
MGDSHEFGGFLLRSRWEKDAVAAAAEFCHPTRVMIRVTLQWKNEEEGIVGAIAVNVIYDFERAIAPQHFDSDDKYEFTEPGRIKNLVKNYSQFVSFPIYTWQEKSRTLEDQDVKKKNKTISEKYWDWELVSETKLIWMENSKEMQKEEDDEFYKKTFNEFLDPLAYAFFSTEGEVEFQSVLYILGMALMNNEDIVNPRTKNIRLYVKRVFISDDFDGELVCVSFLAMRMK